MSCYLADEGSQTWEIMGAKRGKEEAILMFKKN